MSDLKVKVYKQMESKSPIFEEMEWDKVFYNKDYVDYFRASQELKDASRHIDGTVHGFLDGKAVVIDYRMDSGEAKFAASFAFEGMEVIEHIKKSLQANEGQFHKDKIALDEDVKYLLDKLQIAINALDYFEGFHIRGIEDQHLEVIRLKATEFLKDIRE